MRRLDDTSSAIEYRDSLERDTTVGFVPTMGALHDGHGVLIQESVKENDVTIVSIFVNPAQFAPHEDFGDYPQKEKSDLEYCEEKNVTAVFIPSSKEEVYGAGFGTTVTVDAGEAGRNPWSEGAFRPTFFKGVATALTKMFNIIRPTHTYFGQKDAQQVAVVHRLIEDLYPRIQLRVIPTVRDDSPEGLALSSRNIYLNDEQRNMAKVLFQSLSAAKKQFDNGLNDPDILRQTVAHGITEHSAITLLYISVCHRWTMVECKSVIEEKEPCLICVAAVIGRARLIDNIVLRE